MKQNSSIPAADLHLNMLSPLGPLPVWFAPLTTASAMELLAVLDTRELNINLEYLLMT